MASYYSCGDLNLLHLLWEHPERIIGGLGVAGSSLCEALESIDGVGVQVLYPSANLVDGGDEGSGYGLDVGELELLDLASCVMGDFVNFGGDSVVSEYAREVKAWCDGGMEGVCSVVHAHDWMTAAAGVYLQRVLGVPLIVHVHSTEADRVGLHAKGAIYKHEKWAMEQADAVIAVSDFTKRLIIDHYDISADKVKVVRNGGVAVSGVFSRVTDEPVVMFAGRLVAQKCPEFALEVIVAALRRVRGARGVIVGGGDKLEVLRELVKFKGMGGRIEVLGGVPRGRMADVYSDADVMIVPSVSEPFGLVAVEAAQAGVAVILSDRCGAFEVLGSAWVADCYDLDVWVDGVVCLLEDAELRGRQVRQQLRELESYGWLDAAHSVVVLVRGLLGK